MTLTEFLLARIAEDEAAVYSWDSDARSRVATVWTGTEPGYTTVASDGGWDDVWIADGREVGDARHVRILLDPARVLAECEAKRRIVEHCEPDPLTKSPGDEYVLCLLALPYVDHPDYREEWRP